MTPYRSPRAAVLLAAAIVAQLSCSSGPDRVMTAKERQSAADSIRAFVVGTYDLGRPDAVERLMSLYPATGPVYSVSSGNISTTRAELQRQVETFWKYVGSNMRNPRWEWTAMHIDVLAPDAAVMTASYRVPHLNPMNVPHTIAGAWTAVFAKRDGRWVILHEHLSDVPSSAGHQP